MTLFWITSCAFCALWLLVSPWGILFLNTWTLHCCQSLKWSEGGIGWFLVSSWTLFFFRFQRSVLDLSLQWRFARLPNNAKLEMVPVSNRVGVGNTVCSFCSVSRFVQLPVVLGKISSDLTSKSMVRLGQCLSWRPPKDWLRCGGKWSFRAGRLCFQSVWWWSSSCVLAGGWGDLLGSWKTGSCECIRS